MTARLAIDGGTPVRTTLLPYGRQSVDEDDMAAVKAALASDWLTTGPVVDAYEQAFARYVEADHAVAVSSGTAALHTAVATAGIGPGDEVITSPMTFAASANCIVYCGATPVFADIQPDTGNLDPDAVANAMTPRTRAIIAVDYTGQPADLDALQDLADRRGLVLIEDAAQALGASYKDRKVGSIAPLTTFSTHPVKHIATAEGGMVTTADAALAERMRRFRNHGIEREKAEQSKHGDWFYEIRELGYNYRLPDVLCALGQSQLAKADAWLARRSALAAKYDRAIERLPGVGRLRVRPDRTSSWHLYVVKFDLAQFAVDRSRLFRALRAEGIGVNVHHIPVYWHPYYEGRGYRRGLCPRAEALYERIVTLPLWPGMADADADDVIEALRKIVQAYRR